MWQRFDPAFSLKNCYLSDSKQALYPLLIVGVYKRRIPKAQLSFFALAAHHVGSFRLKTLDLTGTSALETFLCTGVCLHLRHYEYL